MNIPAIIPSHTVIRSNNAGDIINTIILAVHMGINFAYTNHVDTHVLLLDIPSNKLEEFQNNLEKIK